MSRYERRYLTPTWCDRCLDLLLAEKRAREELVRSEARNPVRRWLDNAPAYEPTHPARDSRRHDALENHYDPRIEPLVHVLWYGGASLATDLTLPKLRRQWPAP